MKKYILVLVISMVLALTGTSFAALINLTTNTGSGEDLLFKIYNDIYGTSVADNDALELLENNLLIGSGLYSSTSGLVRVGARYAAATVTLASYDGITGPGIGDVPIVSGLVGGKYTNVPPQPPAGYGVANSSLFGVWGQTSLGKFYSEDFRNSDGKYHFIVLNTPDPDRFLVGFEDNPNGDWDFNDFVFETENLKPGTPIPEPTSMLLFGMGILGLGFRARKKS